MNEPSVFAIWLVPCPEQERVLAAQIRELAGAWNATPFAPHMTLFSHEMQPRETLEALIREAATRFLPLSLNVSGIGQSEHFFRTLFLELEHDQALNPLFDLFYTGTGNLSAYRLQPHVSLLYQELEAEPRRHLADAVQQHFETLRFDRLALCVPGDPDRGWRNIAAWQTWYRFPQSE